MREKGIEVTHLSETAASRFRSSALPCRGALER